MHTHLYQVGFSDFSSSNPNIQHVSEKWNLNSFKKILKLRLQQGLPLQGVSFLPQLYSPKLNYILVFSLTLSPSSLSSPLPTAHQTHRYWREGYSIQHARPPVSVDFLPPNHLYRCWFSIQPASIAHQTPAFNESQALLQFSRIPKVIDHGAYSSRLPSTKTTQTMWQP